MKKSEAIKFIENNNLCVVATCSLKNKPEAATMAYVVDENQNFYFSTHKGSRKVKNLKKNNMAAIVIGVSEESPSIQIDGIGDFVSTEIEIEKIKRMIREKTPQYFSYVKMKDVIFFKIKAKAYWHNGAPLS